MTRQGTPCDPLPVNRVLLEEIPHTPTEGGAVDQGSDWTGGSHLDCSVAMALDSRATARLDFWEAM